MRRRGACPRRWRRLLAAREAQLHARLPHVPVSTRRLEEQPSSACCCVGAWALKKGPCVSDPREVSARAAHAIGYPSRDTNTHTPLSSPAASQHHLVSVVS